MSDGFPPTDLPVEEVIDDLRAALAGRRRAVLVAPPGAGKTTLVPLRLLDEPWVAGRRIVMLEPRRLAARAAARRMAELLGEEVGDTVGYQTRDERRIGPRTRIEVLTEGILTRRLQTDPSLEGTALVVFDEVHERNVPTDLGLAFLLDALAALGSDTAVLAMSATLDSVGFADLLGEGTTPAPVVHSAGRQHPVDIRFAPRAKGDRLEDAVAATVVRALREDEGDVLVFLPGIGEISRAATRLAADLPGDVDVHRLAGALPLAEQDDALRGSRPGRQRVVLSTDIAESSLTVAGIRIVVDAGLARVPRLDPRTGLTELVTVTSSRASADQRSGRAGRTSPGVAWRMWSRIEDATRLAHLPAEIGQVDLCQVALEIAAWGTESDQLRFLDPPPARALALARETLAMLRLLDDAGRPTVLGLAVLGLPLHPRLGTMVAVHRDGGARGWVACVVAALLEERDPFRGRPDSLPVDLALRVKAVLGLAGHDAHDRGAGRRILDIARDIARRAGVATVDVGPDSVDEACGRVLLSAYPDRLARRRSSPGQFVMRGGGEVRFDTKDPLAREEFIVAADVDARRGTSSLRRGAGLDLDAVADVLGDDVTVEDHLSWNRERDDLVRRVVRRVGAITLDERLLPAEPGPATVAELVSRIRATSFSVLGGDGANHLRRRVAFLRRHLGDEWPDWSTSALLADLDDWLVPHLVGARGRADLDRLDLPMLLLARLGWDASVRLDDMAPPRWTPPKGRPVDIDYSDPDAPSIAVRVQHLFGTRAHPTVLGGRVPLRVHLLSPADRPIQITADLPGFWSGSWAEVRREMAGRYPKHDWPVDPGA